MEFKSTVVIEASPEKIWNVLSDLSAWPTWDPFCEKVVGELKLGATVKVFTKLSPGRAFPVKVVELAPGEKMTWSGGMPLGLFKGVRTFTLVQAGPGRVTFTLHEIFSGPMLRLIGKSIPDMTDAFNKFGSGLKNKAEGK